MAGPAKPFTSSLFGIAAGAGVLIIVTAILTSAILAPQVAGDLRHATNQLQEIRQADAKAEQARIHRGAVMQAQLASLQRQAARQVAEEKAQRRYLAQLSKALRTHGIPVPPPPRVTVMVSPKGPSRSHPASPGHTVPAPRGPSPSPICLLIPTVCVPTLVLPTLLP